MNVVNVPAKVTKGEDLVIISKKEYDELAQLKKVYEFAPTIGQKRALKTARSNRRKGKVLTLNELKRKLVSRN